MPTYIETFDDGPGGWFGWVDNARGPRALEIRDGSAISRSPWIFVLGIKESLQNLVLSVIFAVPAVIAAGVGSSRLAERK